MRAANQRGIAFENAAAPPRAALETVLPLTDHFYFDLKLMDGAKHREYTGADNAQILDNARFLPGRGADILFRQPLIPGVNDDAENIRATADFIRSLGRAEPGLQLIAYHRMGMSKYASLGLPYAMEETLPMPPAQAEAVRAQYEACGIRCTISK